MLKEELISGGGNPTWARVCDTCRCSPSRVYCTADAAYLCTACDARIHSSTLDNHRVLVCEACEQLPAAFVCKADSASLCVDCDAKVHSANPLASRHQRFPISACLYAASPTNLGRRMLGSVQTMDEGFDEEDEDEAASWLLLNPSNNNDNNITKEIKSTDNKYTNGCSIGGEVVDEYLELVEFDLGGGGGDINNGKLDDDSYKRHHEHHQYTVPNGVRQGINEHRIHHNQPHSFQMDLDFDHIKPYAYTNGLPMPHTMSVSSLEVGVVPESTTSEISTSHNTIRPQSYSNGTSTIDLFSTTSHIQQQPAQLSPMDREARVQRYRQKKKTRKFEKTIRYASRKAYAETRPRLKGRFVKRTADDDIVEPNNVSYDTGYGVVPSF